MSFLDSNNLEFLAARITQKGRNAIAKGNFKIDYFQVGDSEYDYTAPFNVLTGHTTHQKVMAPFDKDSGVKYPFGLDSSVTTTYGVPVQNSLTTPIRNVMGPAGFVSNYLEYDAVECTGTTVECIADEVTLLSISGGTSINVTDGEEFQNCGYITLVFDRFNGPTAVITGNTNSLVYKVLSISGNTLNLDRALPNLSSLSGYAQVVCNSCEQEYPITATTANVCLPNDIDTTQQLNPWTLNIVWDKKLIGTDVGPLDETLSGYTGNRFVSVKELLGYTSTGQTFTNMTGGTVDYPTSYKNTLGEQIIVKPEEQRCIAVIHYSEVGDLRNDPERFFRYDDYISYKTGITGSDISIVDDVDGNPISDTEYFEVYLPFLLYHRSTGTTIGAKFLMDETDYYVKSTKNERHQLMFRFLLDEMGNRVGKVFPKNKIVVFDDQELVATLDYRSNRKYTLPSPKVNTVASDDIEANSLFSGTTGQTYWVTYVFSDTQYGTSSAFNALPCNYFTSINNVNVPSSLTIKFSGTSFQHMESTLNGFRSGFNAKYFYVLIQETDIDELPISFSWTLIDKTGSLTKSGGYIVPSSLTGNTIVITKDDFDNGVTFDLETHMGSDYLGSLTSTIQPQFGDEQPFPGSVRLVRASDIEELNFLVNLPSTQFTTTQNPTYVTQVASGYPKITEVALLDSNKETLVVAKATTPITRLGTQVFAVKLDF
jgi:hypothetical protein